MNLRAESQIPNLDVYDIGTQHTGRNRELELLVDHAILRSIAIHCEPSSTTTLAFAFLQTEIAKSCIKT